MAEDDLENTARTGGRDAAHPLHQKEGRLREDQPDAAGLEAGAKRNHAESLSGADGSSADAHHDERDGIHADAPLSAEQAEPAPGSIGRVDGRAQAGAATGADVGGKV